MVTPRNKIYFHYLAQVSLKDRNKLKIFLEKLFTTEKKRLEIINYIFCNDEYLLELNRHHLKHDTYTDIITFELHQPEQPIISDIYISIDRVKENAKLYSISISSELLRVIFHGALHLCGYKDKRSQDKKMMTSKENFYLRRYLVSRETP